MKTCRKCGCEVDEMADCCPGCLSQHPEVKPLKNNVILWTESDPLERDRLHHALVTATEPIRAAYRLTLWEGQHLTCPGNLNPEHWRNLYFYLSGYGDAQFQLQGQYPKRQPPAIPASR